ncbi:luciferin 4-monooxygenase-like [Ostrinia nubilalis]|uniref:luciferin 4-monooxygenase-like n=1 Tax=Ostrinia nubilalis TaxID=29057 RepID=UPI003082554D
MSHAVVRGAPTAAQRYADGALDAWLRARGREPSREARARVSAAQLLLHCMRQAPDFVCMINGATGEQTTNREMLELAIPFARKLLAQGLKGKTVMLVARDHERTVAVFLGLLLAGVLAYLTDPGATKYELQHYLRLVEPALVFCDEATQAAVRVATADAPAPAHVLPIHDDALLDYIQGHTDDLDSFEAEDSEEGAASLLLPTSGSTGLPKAAQYNQRALVAQLPTVWMHYEKFPTPTERVMLLTTPQWSTFTITVATCCLYNVTLVMSPKEATVENVLDMMQRCRPTWTFFGPPFAKQLAKAATPDHFSSLETVMTLGSQVSPDIMAALKEKMAPGSNLCDGFGMTEAHGFLAVAPRGAAPGCQGRCANIFHYRLVKNDDEDAATDEEGELYIKGSTIIKSYYKNESELAANMTADGWLRTGDAFRQDRARRLHYCRRIKFCFKYDNLLVSPEELERVVGQLPGVAECVVSDSARGPAAAVVLRAGASEPDARRAIHRVVETTLSDHKRLRGGVAFVAAIPRTHTGKAHRQRAKDLIQRLIEEGACCY